MENRIRELREEFRMTQQELAKKVGVSRQTIISLENGRYNPSINLAFKVSKAFDKLIEDIFIYNEEED
ncbi:helix-turn-helix transcriptional regulator [Vallitalea guaymasensis]|uniref:Helix-turn-helix transcriptional regulator n=1 Tax=Vallitalea guaymasensis TaxID=1185412 RepID=A0A8J8M8L5_9FIRM|nr:helix-turn-helix transcriptional regulator [Vallitalea guaymasensis]QUH28371.1 helix-turn-helix transcriptional regulator [Vallitalea guaymasensis]